MRGPKPTGQRVSRQTSIQAPIDGLNAKSALADMKETEAVVMTNMFPTPSTVDLRNGYFDHVTGLPAEVDTVASYNTATVVKLFAASGTGIYDVTTAGIVGAPVVTGQTNPRWQFITLGTAGGYFLMMVNGSDDMQMFNGTTWQAINAGSTPAITGVLTKNIAHINNFKNRVWLIEKDSFRAWYLPVSSIGGAAQNLDLAGLFKLGGYLMAMANWTIDNAAGIDDYAAFITSAGEVALYKGTDPSSAATWSLVGTFRMGSPIGRRCFTKAGADVLVLTTDGAFPLSKALLTDRSQANLAASDNIRTLMNSDIQLYGANFGWQPIIHPIGQKLFINVPTVQGVESHQYVMHTAHGAWCKFEGWNANTFETLGDTLYFGGLKKVCVADAGQSDNGSNINASCQQAFSYFGTAGYTKLWKMARPIFFSDGDFSPALALNTDFALTRNPQMSSFLTSTTSLWDVASWDTASWSMGDVILKRWQSITGTGFAGGINLALSLQGINVRWASTDFVYEVGGTF